MLIRIDSSKIIILLLLILIEHTTTGCKSSEKQIDGMNKSSKPSFLIQPLVSLIRKHQKHDTLYDGVRCQMYPTCSSYALEALQRHSIFAIFLIIDRIFYREGGDLEKKYLRIGVPLSSNGIVRFYDPVGDSIFLAENRNISLFGDENQNKQNLEDETEIYLSPGDDKIEP